jgi:hypothetical protein
MLAMQSRAQEEAREETPAKVEQVVQAQPTYERLGRRRDLSLAGVSAQGEPEEK